MVRSVPRKAQRIASGAPKMRQKFKIKADTIRGALVNQMVGWSTSIMTRSYDWGAT